MSFFLPAVLFKMTVLKRSKKKKKRNSASWLQLEKNPRNALDVEEPTDVFSRIH